MTLRQFGTDQSSIVAAQGGILNDVASSLERTSDPSCGCETNFGSLGVYSKTLDCCTLRLFENIGLLHFTRLGRDLTHEQVIKKLNTDASISHHSIQICNDVPPFLPKVQRCPKIHPQGATVSHKSINLFPSPTSTSHQCCPISFHTCVFPHDPPSHNLWSSISPSRALP